MEDKILVVDYFEKFKISNNTWVVPYFNQEYNLWWMPLDLKEILDEYGIQYTIQNIVFSEGQI